MENKGNNQAPAYLSPLYMADVTPTDLYELSPLILIQLLLAGSMPVLQIHKNGAAEKLSA